MSARSLAPPAPEPYRFGEELAHSIIHGIGIVLAIVGLSVLVALAAMRGGALHVTAVAISGAARILSVVFCLLLGWCVVWVFGPLARVVPARGLQLLFAGGLAYTLGVVFYVWKRLPYHHAIWHVFVLAGSVLHFFAILVSAI